MGAPALAEIANSKHDLSSSNTNPEVTYKSTDVSFSCYFCHSVHTPDEGSGGFNAYPMWNKDLSALGPYLVYSSATLDSTPADLPNPASLACLSCHDGTIALNVIRSGVLGSMTPSDSLVGRASHLTTDLSNDHPISFVYDPALDDGLDTFQNAHTAGIVFYGPQANEFECGSCHNPHDPSHRPFLRMSNSGSALCLACHLK